MRLIALIIAILVAYSVNGSAQTDVLPPSGLQVGYHIEEDFGLFYSARTRQDFVFFRGEPITFRLQIGNLGPASVVFATTTPDRPFELRAFKAPPLPPGFTGERPRVITNPRRYQDEQDIDLQTHFSAPVRAWPGGKSDVRLERETSLDPGEGLEWVLSVPSADLDPGLYRIEARVNGEQRGRGALQDYATVRFEVRAASVEQQPEILRREALRRFSKQDHEGSRQAVAALLKVHPNSSQARLILAIVADAEGRKDEAAGHRANADAILRGGRDELLVKYKRGGTN